MTTHPDWSKLLEWAEQCGVENLKRKLDSADTLAKEAEHTLTLIVAAAGASLAYAIKAFEPEATTPIVFGTAVLCGYLTIVGFVLVVGGMLIRSIPALHQEPKNIAQPGYSIDDIREEELKNIQERIKQASERNTKTTRYINFARIATMLSPLVFLLAAGYKIA